MRYGDKEKVILLLIISLLFFSCGVKEKSIHEKMMSGITSEIKSALTDMWRTGQTDLLANAIQFLETDELKEHTAYSLALLDFETADTLIFNKMKSSSKKEGYLLYFYMTLKNRDIKQTILSHIKSAADEYDDISKIIAYMVLGDSDANAITSAVKNYDKTKVLWFDNLEKELLILIGKKRHKNSMKFAERIKQNPKLKPFALWAINRIKVKSILNFDFDDRVIKQNNLWKKYEKNPVIPIVADTYKSVHTANPDTLVRNNMVYCYYRGGDGHDRICLATTPYDLFNGIRFDDYAKNPIVSNGKKGEFDDAAVLDPATVYFKNKVFMYYSGLGTGEDAVGLAVSDNFYDFVKVKNNPVLIGRAPEVVVKDNIIHMFYVEPNVRGGYSVLLATSSDGYNFKKYSDYPVFMSDADRKAWDGTTVTTPRIVVKNGVYYMMYCGDNKYRDYPPFFGIAFSYDLVNWYRGTQNPVFSRSQKGLWDDGGIWYGQVMEYKNKLYMWYEGWGGGIESHEKEYGSAHSQIGLATSDYSIEEML